MTGVSAVIVTTGRKTLDRAIASVQAQTLPVLETIVVVDGAATLDVSSVDHSVRFIFLAERKGANYARMAGISAARGRLIALLDDDDEWLPQKLELQIAEYKRLTSLGYNKLIIGCRLYRAGLRGRASKAVPSRLIRAGENVSGYLLERRNLRKDEAILASSMLLFERRLAMEFEWNASLIRHQDWDWLIRVQALGGAMVAMVPDPLVVAHYDSNSASVSMANTWESSLAWAESMRSLLSSRQFSDFLLCVTAPVAIHYNERVNAGKIGLLAFKCGSPSLKASLVFAIHFLIPTCVRRRLPTSGVPRTQCRTAPPLGHASIVDAPHSFTQEVQNVLRENYAERPDE